METPSFEGETENPPAGGRQEKMELADAEVVEAIKQTLLRVSERMKEQKTVSLQGREYTIDDAYDERLAREQLTTQDLQAQSEQAGERGDYYLQKEFAALAEFSRLKENVTAQSAHIARSYPQGAKFLIRDDDNRDTP